MDNAIVGVGNTATVYEWENGKVLKLFYSHYSKEIIEKEFMNAKATWDMNFNKPLAYEMIQIDNRFGIVYDKVEGESLLDIALQTYDIKKCAEYMADIHKTILKNEISGVDNYKDFLRYFIENSKAIDSYTRQETLGVLSNLEDGHTLCHGDFHPGNILISNGKATVIDFMNICSGPYLYDVARTVYLVQYTPVPKDSDNKELILQFKKTLVDLYLEQMKVTREMIKDYLAVITVARKGECPDE